jgi:hypothetical protein
VGREKECHDVCCFIRMRKGGVRTMRDDRKIEILHSNDSIDHIVIGSAR